MRHIPVTDTAAAAKLLQAGGLLAYPTEAVFGLGCDPEQHKACQRLFALKQRPLNHGVLLIAADFEQLRPWIGIIEATTLAQVRASWPGPYTWVLPSSPQVPTWISGQHQGIAVRITAHPVAAALCRDFGGPLVSTSANRHGQAPARSVSEVAAAFGEDLDALLEGSLGGLQQPTPIRDARTGVMLRNH